MQNLKLLFTALQQLLTLQRLSLLVIIGTVVGTGMAKLFPGGLPWYAGAIYGVTGITSVIFTLWVFPLESDET